MYRLTAYSICENLLLSGACSTSSALTKRDGSSLDWETAYQASDFTLRLEASKRGRLHELTFEITIYLSGGGTISHTLEIDVLYRVLDPDDGIPWC